MRIIRTIYLATVLLLVNFSYAGSKDMPAPPTAKGAAATTADGLPVEDGSPIDQNLVFLMMAGLVLGSVFVYRNKIKKASM
ncbi:hypothetical protein [Flavobacterium pectinovorum]|uniref:LPXTG cell wall anchor domain-containing protein n=1 Tax=Flavobacterium pectinovorum TaxID=29533 RepID=A0A502EMP4_9FLAO|nr:hypothetical protein [Flavobacterium pectinovorum]TPG38757.1 hypothetical protein EAH81_14850 [Flavobacterium pectinovorum]